jgi:hypothetical protein
MKLGVAEILEKTSSMTSRSDRIRMLQENDGVALQTVLRGAFDPAVKWLLPEGAPPYKPNDLVDQEHIFYHECRKMYLFVEGGNPDLNQLRRESLFVQLLETVSADDAKLLLAIKDKYLPYPGVTPDIIKEAFPGLLP